MVFVIQIYFRVKGGTKHWGKKSKDSEVKKKKDFVRATLFFRVMSGTLAGIEKRKPGARVRVFSDAQKLRRSCAEVALRRPLST